MPTQVQVVAARIKSLARHFDGRENPTSARATSRNVPLRLSAESSRSQGIMMRCYDAQTVRTTLNLDDDVLDTTRAIARAERRALGAVVSDLVRRGLVPSQPRIDDDDGFPIFRVPRLAQPITDEVVRTALEEG
jgi:hypothetical protein